jgi:hypothetical protein
MLNGEIKINEILIKAGIGESFETVAGGMPASELQGRTCAFSKDFTFPA